MFRNVMIATLAVTGCTLAQQFSSGKMMIANFTTTQKAIQSDAVVVGKVSTLEKEEVEVLPYAGSKDKVKMRVAIIKIEDGLVGAKNITHIKVLIPGAAAEQPMDLPLPGGPGGIRPAIIRRGGIQQISVKEGDEAMYFLVKHPTAANYYHFQAGFAPVNVKSPEFKPELAKVKATLSTLTDPMTALKATKVEDRLAAAAVLVQKYRRGLSVPAKEEAIPAEETKAILKTLADADWTVANNPPAGFDYNSAPNAVASALGLYPGSPNGLPALQVKPGENYNVKYAEAFKAWYAKSGDKYEIKKYVPKN